MFIDKIEVTFSGGKGGNGLVSFGKMAKSGPDGGNGGRGGNLYLIGDSDLTLLNQFSRKTNISAEDGEPGGQNKRTGRDGKDLEVKLPFGTNIIDKVTGKTLLEINNSKERYLFCSGGSPGLGNYEFRSSVMTTPMISKPGESGETKNVILNLKLIADFGLIGLPNAGKSSLLNELTNSNAKTANYAFTTLSTNLGTIQGKIIADIPGLIEGASSGKGLGLSFLKHIEKVRVIFHCIAADSTNVKTDYQIVRKELEIFNKDLINKKEVIIITKSDLITNQQKKKIESQLKRFSRETIFSSIHDPESIAKLKKVFNQD